MHFILDIPQGVPEIDPASNKYRAPPQPKPASQAPQKAPAATTSECSPPQIPSLTSPISANSEQVSLIISVTQY